MKSRVLFAMALVAALPRLADAQVLYSQNFENPTGFVNDGGDVNIYNSVNTLYGGQPAGFTFSQNFTVETLLIGGSSAFGVGFKDPQARGGSYALGLLSDSQDDYLGLAFNVGAKKFLNFSVDISDIDLDRYGCPCSTGVAPTFRFSLFDNPGGAAGLGSGTALSFAEVTGIAGINGYTFNWSNFIVALDATGNTDGNVILRADLLAGGYAAMDNFLVVASDDAGNVGVVPEPSTYAMLALGLATLGVAARSRKRNESR